MLNMEKELKSEKTSDRRVRKTISGLKQVILELLREKEAEKITVTEICKKADINRSTFYQYFYDTYALIEAVEADFFEETDILAERIRTRDYPPQDVTEMILQHIYVNREIFSLFIIKNERKGFQEKLDERVSALFREKVLQAYEIPDDVKKEKLDDILLFLTAGFYAAFKQWLNSGCEEDMKKLAGQTTALSQMCLDQQFAERYDRKGRK